MILNERFPPDRRVEREAVALSQAGHEVVILCKGEEGKPAREELASGLKVIRTAIPRGLLRRHYPMLRFTLSFRDVFWERAISRLVREMKPHVLHVHDLPLLGSAFVVAHAHSYPHRIRIVADFHENFAASIEARGKNRSLLKRYRYSVARWQAYEIRCAQQADRIIVVVEESRQRLSSHGIPASKIYVVSNTEDPAVFQAQQTQEDESLADRYAANFVCCHVGLFGRHRGIDEAIEAMARLSKRIPSLRLLLVGQSKRGYEQELRELASRLGVGHMVEFAGMQPFHRVASFIRVSDVCLAPPRISEQTNASAPNKLFQYMLLGKPIIVSNCKSLERIIKQTECGLVYHSGDPEELAACIAKLYEDEDLRRRLGENGRVAALRQYNWQVDAQTLVDMYKNLEEEVQIGASST